MENRRKVTALLELAGKTDVDITRVLDNEDKLGTGIFLQSSFVSQRVKSYIERAKVRAPEITKHARNTWKKTINRKIIVQFLLYFIIFIERAWKDTWINSSFGNIEVGNNISRTSAHRAGSLMQIISSNRYIWEIKITLLAHILSLINRYDLGKMSYESNITTRKWTKTDLSRQGRWKKSDGAPHKWAFKSVSP